MAYILILSTKRMELIQLTDFPLDSLREMFRLDLFFYNPRGEKYNKDSKLVPHTGNVEPLCAPSQFTYCVMTKGQCRLIMPLSHPHCVPPGWTDYLVSLLGLLYSLICVAKPPWKTQLRMKLSQRM